jgi:CheY-like chemotaxis protein
VDAGLECRACADAAELFALQVRWPPDAYIVSADLLHADEQLLARIRSDAATKLLVYSTEHGLTAPSLLDSSELLVPSLRGLVPTGASVLVVEDDDKYRSLLEFELQQAGYRVRTAPNGREALSCIREGVADAVVLDLIMPGMDGIAVLERLQSTGGIDIPILVYTAMDDPSVAIAAKELGATEVFRKDGSGKAVYTAVTARVRRVLAGVLAGDGSSSPEQRRSDA